MLARRHVRLSIASLSSIYNVSANLHPNQEDACATLHLAVVMSHLQPCPLEATLHIETFVRFGAVQDGLVAPYILGDVVQCLNDAQTQLLALLIFRDCNVLDMSD